MRSHLSGGHLTWALRSDWLSGPQRLRLIPPGTEEEEAAMGQSRSSSCPQVILLGLDSSGKSTLLARLLTGRAVQTCPTVGFNVGTLDLDKKTSLTVWDVGGQRSMRPSWRLHLEGCRALVFVVDSADPPRLLEARGALRGLLRDPLLGGVPLLVLANKRDLPGCMTIREVSERLALPSCSERLWEVQACSALQGLGLQQALTSLTKMIRRS